MKKSISIWSFYGDWNLKQKLQLARDAGFEGLEIDLSNDGPITLETTDEELEAIAAQAEELGITLSGLATGLYWQHNPTSADPGIRATAKKVLEKQLQVASRLHIDTILVVPGAVGADFMPECETVPYEAAFERASTFIQSAIPLAEELGIHIGIENVWNKFLLSPLEMKYFIDQFKTPDVGSYFDVGNVLAIGYPEDWISILGERIKRVHFKDYRRAVGTVDGFCDLLSGDVNWPAVMEALKQVGYDGWITAEMIPPVPFYKYAPETLIENTSRAMDKIFAM